MLRSIKDLSGYTIQAIDGDIGRVREFYFDDRFWTVRYLVADTGNWLVGKKVLISPTALSYPDWEKQIFPVQLTREQVENSPGISSDKPVSRQMETDLHGYYGWPPYWHAAAYIIAAQASVDDKKDGDPHLRSTAQVMGYHIQAADGEIGHVDDFIVDDELWTLRYLVVDTRNWLPGKKVLVASSWVEQVNWAERKIELDLDKKMIQNSPEFDPSVPVNREYEIRFYDYYGRPYDWARIEPKEKVDERESG